mmetsp:Transcript_61611/g.127315  ORF Transcript_61611/g.127315 Transcript_61611/m.127315 type:complete len:122 (-) Transcript_61611:278-643(-)
MEEYLNTRFTAQAIHPLLRIIRINSVIREEPFILAFHDSMIESAKEERDNIIENNQCRFPEDILLLHTLCEWVTDIQNVTYNFNEIFYFLENFQVGRRPDSNDFIAHRVHIKFTQISNVKA